MTEHVVCVTPHRVESPVFRRGGKYQLVYIRGKTKVRPPGYIECREGCFLHTDQLGSFGNVAIHFKHKSSSQKFPYAPKILTFEILDCNVPGSSGALIGECQVDIAQLIDTTTDSCHTKASFDFKMCGFGASLLLTVQVVPRGYPVPPLMTSRSAISNTSRPQALSNASQPSTRNGGKDAVVKGGMVEVPRDSSMAVLVALEDTDLGSTGTPEGASAAISLASLVDIRLRKLPRARLLQEVEIDEAARQLVMKANADFGSNAEAVLQETLRHQLQRLQALRAEELDWSQSCDRDYAAIRTGRTSGIDASRSLPLQLLGAKYDVAKSYAPPAPEAPLATSEVAIRNNNYVPPSRQQPAPRPIPPTQNQIAPQAMQSTSQPTKPEVVVPALEPSPPPAPEVEAAPPGTEGMQDMFNNQLSREPKKPVLAPVSEPLPIFAEPPAEPTTLQKPEEPVPKANMFESPTTTRKLPENFDVSNPFASTFGGNTQPAAERSMFAPEKPAAPVTVTPLFKTNMFSSTEEEPAPVSIGFTVTPSAMFDNGGSSNASKNPSFGGFGGFGGFGAPDTPAAAPNSGWDLGRNTSIHFGGGAVETPSFGTAFHVDPNPMSMFGPSGGTQQTKPTTKGPDPFARDDDSD